jgi:hypothetical protein
MTDPIPDVRVREKEAFTCNYRSLMLVPPSPRNRRDCVKPSRELRGRESSGEVKGASSTTTGEVLLRGGSGESEYSIRFRVTPRTADNGFLF